MVAAEGEYITAEEEFAAMSPERQNRVRNIERELQEVLDERAAGLNELINMTVSLHRQIKEDVQAMFDQDREEDVLVEECRVRTVRAEEELEKNPCYGEFKKAREGGEGEECWKDRPHLSGVNRHWDSVHHIDAEQCKMMLSAYKDFTPITEELFDLLTEVLSHNPMEPCYITANGRVLPVFNLKEDTDAVTLFKEATSLLPVYRHTHPTDTPKTTSEKEIAELSRALDILQAQPIGENLVDKLIRNKWFVKEHLIPAVVGGKGLWLCRVGVQGSFCEVGLRGFVIKGKLKAVEVVGGWMPNERMKKAVQATAESVGGTCAVDMSCCPKGVVSIAWVYPLDPALPKSVDWESLCHSAHTESPPTWHPTPYTSPTPHIPDLLRLEAASITPTNPAWGAPAPTPTTRLLTEPATRRKTAAHVNGGDVGWWQVAGTSAAMLATGAVLGYAVSRKR